MFTGIIDHTATITSLEENNGGVRLAIETKFPESSFSLGESIAVDGVCLTVTETQGSTFYCELSPETLACTKASDYQLNQIVNIERPLRVGDLLGGHFVTGHVDETIRVASIQKQGEFCEIQFSASNAYLIAKGSVTINGVSLTVNTVTDKTFSVMLIPHTLKKTNLCFLNENDTVNVEWDYLAKIATSPVSRCLPTSP